MSVIVKPLDDCAPLEVTTALLENSSGVSPETALVCVGDVVHVGEQGGYLRYSPSPTVFVNIYS
jgi:hypothetical protein